jgi:eukaryotic-like serine/threonine-protein kinase
MVVKAPEVMCPRGRTSTIGIVSSQVGTLLNGRYRLDAQIGTGGMSTVYRAFDTVLERQVAIKLMHREIASDSDQLERFRREARAVAQLNHPHIVTVIDAGEDEAMPYIVFEYVEGETLKDRIRRYGRLPIQESIAYAIEIARALGVAHERGIVHRDVKPQNVLVDEEGSAKVTDFGIARTLDQEGLTADGRVLGTTDYVSPEQALGHPVTGQSDLYSLGIVLFEMLTGDVPFKGDNQVAVAMKHVREQLPDVQVRRPEVSNALAAVLEKATAKETEKRHPDDRALIAALEEVLAIETQRSGQSTGEVTAVLRTLPSSTQRRLPARVIHPVRLVAALVVIAAVVVAVVLLLADRTERGTAQRQGVDHSQPATGLESVSLGQSRAHDFDPYGDDQDEHGEDAGRVLDDDPGTAWTTETYRDGFGVKPGVGIYVDAKPGVVGKRLDIRTTTTGWTGKVYVSNSVDRDAKDLSGWQDLGTTIDASRKRMAIQLDTAGQKFRYYLVWITKLPPSGQVGISEIVLFEPRA